MRPGRAIRADARAASLAPCAACGHGQHLHRELPRDHPDYRPLLFACGACDCRLDLTAGPTGIIPTRTTRRTR